MFILTNTGKAFDILAAINTSYSDYTELCLYIVDADENEVRNVFSSPLETELLTVYDDFDEIPSQYVGFTNLIMIKTAIKGLAFTVLKKPEA